MRKVIPLIKILKNLKVNCDILDTFSEVYYKVFKDNQSRISVAESKKLPARTNHIVIKYQPSRSLVDNKTIRIKYIDRKKQLVDILTEPIENNQFFKLRFMLMGW